MFIYKRNVMYKIKKIRSVNLDISLGRLFSEELLFMTDENEFFNTTGVGEIDIYLWSTYVRSCLFALPSTPKHCTDIRIQPVATHVFWATTTSYKLEVYLFLFCFVLSSRNLLLIYETVSRYVISVLLYLISS